MPSSRRDFERPFGVFLPPDLSQVGAVFRLALLQGLCIGEIRLNGEEVVQVHHELAQALHRNRGEVGDQSGLRSIYVRHVDGLDALPARNRSHG